MSQATLLPALSTAVPPVAKLQSGQALAFTLHCLPTAQQRARHMTTPNGFHRAYKSETQEANERTLEALLRPHVPPSPLEGGLELSFRAVFPTPGSGSRKEHAAGSGQSCQAAQGRHDPAPLLARRQTGGAAGL